MGAGGRVGSGRPGLINVMAIAVLDDHRRIMMAHTGLRKRKRGGTKGAFRRNATNQPMSATAAGAMVDLLLPIDRMIAAYCQIMLQSKISEALEVRHAIDPFNRVQRIIRRKGFTNSRCKRVA